MNQDFDELVRDSMARFTDGVGVPQDLAARARSERRRKRRIRIGWFTSGGAVAGAAAIAAAALTAGTVTAAGGGVRQHHPDARAREVQTTAMVISRVEHALASAASGSPIAYTRQTNHGVRLYLAPPHGRVVRVRGNVIQTWSRGPLQHVVVGTADGRPALSTVSDNRSGTSVQTSISYQRRVWWRGRYQVPTTTRPALGCRLGAIDRTPAQWAREVRKLLSCGAAVAGRQRVNGVESIRLKLSSSYRRACAGSNGGGRCHPVPVGWTGTLFANAQTYLPVRLVTRGHHYSFLIDFGWLAPTTANLAKLHQRIPAGFRRA
jgi:hypothetical protein